jgi:pseudouridine synthase
MERLQNILAKAGVASRRASAQIISEGRVTVDGVVVTEPGQRFDPSAVRVEVDGKRIGARERMRTIVLYKPLGVLSAATDPFGNRTASDLLVEAGIHERLVPAGRLDKDSEGLLVMTNDGDLALKLTHPRYGHKKTYVVKAAGRWSEEKLSILRGPVEMPDGYITRPVPVRVIGERPGYITIIEFILGEGRKRQIRYMCSAAHLSVVSLKRVKVGNFSMPRDMKPGEWMELDEREISELLA